MKGYVHCAVDSTVLALVTFLLVSSVLYGSSEIERDCPKQVGEGVICSGPHVPLTWLPQIQMNARSCPLPVGEGVLCRGPEAPDGNQSSGSAAFGEAEGTLFIPVLSR